MILVDSSVWIDFFSSSPGRAGTELRRMIEEAEPFALTGIVVTEVLQGLTRDARRIEQYLMQWEMLEPHGFETYREHTPTRQRRACWGPRAASIYRAARAKGITPTTIDAVIAAIALEHKASVFTLDQDFFRIASITRLALYDF